MDEHKDIKTEAVKDAPGERLGFYQFVSLKIEKLTSATYLVTDYISDNEPLKWKLRSRSLDLLSAASGLVKDISLTGGLPAGEKISRLLNELVSLLTVGLSLGGVSKMNLEILREEYVRLGNSLEEKYGSNSLKNYLAVNFQLPIPDSRAGAQASSAGRGMSFNRVLEDQGQKDKQKETANDLYGLNKKDNKKSLRKEQIISWLKDKTWTGIAEISAALPDCGPKTIQRELLEMVSLGILKKQGERRWSRYMLKD